MPPAMHARALVAAAALIALLALLPLLSRPVSAATFTVTTLADSGAGSLRQAMISANASPAADRITFAAATNGGTITLASPLPVVSAAGGALEITGNGATRTTISGAGAWQQLAVAPGATVTLSGVTLTNGSGVSGGAIDNRGTLTVRETIIRGNTATNGGGIYSLSGALILINSTVDGNAGVVGGGIFGARSTLTALNSTLSGNAAATGGGIYLIEGSALVLRNSILANSTSGGGDCRNVSSTVSAQYSLVEDGSCGIAAGTGGNLNGDPALAPGLDLTAGSPARDAGLNSLIPIGVTLDLAGNARIFGPSVDMGAFEFGAGPPLPTPTRTTTANPTATGSPTATPTRTTTPGPTVTGSPGPTPSPTATGSPPVGAPSRLMLPLVGSRPAPAPALPDLVVEAITIAPERELYSAGEPVLISVRIANRGTAFATGFWVDLFINPSTPPDGTNQRWNERCGLVPCYGIAWYVNGLQPGQSVVLTSAQFNPGQSIWFGAFAPGTSELYVFADSWNPGVPTGGVLESDETNNVLARRGFSVSGAASLSTAPQRVELPPRPAP